MDRIEPLQYTFRRIEFTGNVLVRDKAIRKRLLFAEGDIFTRASLVGSIARLRRFKSIDPITFDNFEIRADDRTKNVDIVLCVRDRTK